MTGEAHPVFEKLGMKLVSSQKIDEVLQEEGLKIFFLWGYNCPNCDVAKVSLANEAEVIKSLPFQWYHCNVYEDFEVSTRYGLHGIPVFLFFSGSKNLGRVTSYPGFDAFFDVLKQVLDKSKA